MGDGGITALRNDIKNMKKIIAIAGALALIGGIVTSANAAVSVTDIYVGGPSGSISTCTSGSIGAYSDAAHTTAISTITGTTGTASLHNDCSTEAIYASWPTSSTASVPGTSFNSGAHSTTSVGFFVAGNLTIYKCATAQNAGGAGECPTAGTRSLQATITLSISGSVPTSPRPSASATPTPTATTAASTATAEALALLPKSSTAPKIKFDSGNKGLSSSAKKSLKKVADVALDGYAVRITGMAGMQSGVDEDVVRALARKRANAIRDYLVKLGMDKDDIIVKTKLVDEGKAPATKVVVEPLS